MNNYDKETINANDFIGNYLVKEDIDGEKLVALVDVRAEAVRGAARRKLLASFEEFAKPLILNATNIKRLCKMFGSSDAQDWRGRVLLYVDENVEYGGKITGGIRLKVCKRSGCNAGRTGCAACGFGRGLELLAEF